MADFVSWSGTGADEAIGGMSLSMAEAWPFRWAFEGVEAEGDGGSVVKVSSGSSRARLAAGGEVGGDRIGSLDGEAMA
jgi:hypothetical protein